MSDPAQRCFVSTADYQESRPIRYDEHRVISTSLPHGRPLQQLPESQIGTNLKMSGLKMSPYCTASHRLSWALRYLPIQSASTGRRSKCQNELKPTKDSKPHEGSQSAVPHETTCCQSQSR